MKSNRPEVFVCHKGREGGGGHLDDIAGVTCVALRIRVDEIK